MTESGRFKSDSKAVVSLKDNCFRVIQVLEFRIVIYGVVNVRPDPSSTRIEPLA